MFTSNEIITFLLKTYDIAMIPHNPNPDTHLKALFDYFIRMDTNTIYMELLLYHESYGFENALNVIKYYKGLFDYFDINLDFNIYQKIKPWLSEEAKIKYKNHFYKDYAHSILLDKIKIDNDDVLLDIILDNDIDLYLKIAKKLNIDNAALHIFEKSPMHIFEWLNNCSDIYNELISINKHDFILSNMNGKLNISDDTLKYIIEHTEPNLELFLSIKHKIGLSKLWELSNHKLNPEFYAHLIENLNDLIFVININNMTLNSLETVLNNIKIKFPLLYDNFNSLLFVKKEFQ